MKKKILAITIFCLLVTGYTFAQDGPPKHNKNGKKQNPEEMVKREMKMLKEELNLTETQETFIQKILEESAKKMQTLMESGTKDFDEMSKIREEKDTKIKSVLTEEQMEKYKEVSSRKKDKFKNDDQSPPKDR